MWRVIPPQVVRASRGLVVLLRRICIIVTQRLVYEVAREGTQGRALRTAADGEFHVIQPGIL